VKNRETITPPPQATLEVALKSSNAAKAALELEQVSATEKARKDEATTASIARATEATKATTTKRVGAAAKTTVQRQFRRMLGRWCQYVGYSSRNLSTNKQ
jgi:hypothetical protein